MKVLMLGWEYPPLSSGGLGVACRGLARALRHQGVDIVFVAPWLAWGCDRGSEGTVAGLGYARPGGLPLIRAVPAYSRLATDPDAQRMWDAIERYEAAAVRIAGTERFDLVHAHDWMTVPAALSVRAREGIPMVFHVHSIERDRCPGEYCQDVCRVEQEGLSLADRVIAVSEYERQRIADSYSLDLSRTVVVHNAVEDTEVMAAPHEGVSRWRNTVLFVGRLTPQKGPQHFLLAAAKVLDKLPDARFLIAGGGDMRGELETMAKSLGISASVHFTGFLSRFELDRVYAFADVLVMTSVSEPFGIVALEAMQRGLPVVIPRQAGVGEVARSCVRVDYWDSDAIADAVVELLEDREGLASRLASDGLAEAKRLTWFGAASAVREIYAGLLGAFPA